MAMSRRIWAVRFSIALNLIVFLYICAYHNTWWSDTDLDPNIAAPQVQTINSVNATIDPTLTFPPTQQTTPIRSTGLNKHKGSEIGEPISNPETDTNEVNPIVSINHQLSADEELLTLSSLKDTFGCDDKRQEPRIAQRGDYWVLYNYVPMASSVRCWETLTYATHADYTFLDNLEPLLKRWRAPVSIALHAPGDDFRPTVESIKYLRNCASPLVPQLVTFHVYFSSKHKPKVVPPSSQVTTGTYNCSLPPPWANHEYTDNMYKKKKNLLYPVNVGRNVARESAVTHYLLVSDIELYPSPGLPLKFLKMMKRYDQPNFLKLRPKVFVLPIFEVEEDSQPPVNKTVLVRMLKFGSAIPFHQKVCPTCHKVPKSKEWQAAPETEALHVFHMSKRTGAYFHWEPIFIGTNADPWYDERLSWDGKSDKMTQGYELCVLDYSFLILDNAFLVHRPGIKVFKRDERREQLSAETHVLIENEIIPDAKVMYGVKKGCAV